MAHTLHPRALILLATVLGLCVASAPANVAWTRVEGLMAAVETPFQWSDGSLSLDLVMQQAKLLSAQNVRYVLVAGTTGESVKMTVEEREALTEAWVEAGRTHSLAVYVHVGAEAQQDAMRLARHAGALAVSGVVSMAPSFFKPADPAVLVEWLAPIAAQAAHLPFYYYHIPVVNNLGFSAADILQAADGHISNLFGVKFTDWNLLDFQLVTAFRDQKYDVLFGKDEVMLGALALGCRGFIGSTYNFNGKLMNNVIADFRSGNMTGAQQQQRVEAEMVGLYSQYPNKAIDKAIIRLKFGLDLGPPRLPSLPMTADEEASLSRQLKALGLL
eukprot:CAMPEP_0177647476 /NCGR_PEP_ID=MMETSP0447-20121125/10318_1 /TAXON_ID=0 /ORGANISM="Stygamoeba regulata, Strain BSH-02190019" /LENGTH=329 /DNA_ID=CAMNT_0019150059 /DNA_START=204 /DNA_END=1193 /DNA_ORIENTATION=-